MKLLESKVFNFEIDHTQSKTFEDLKKSMAAQLEAHKSALDSHVAQFDDLRAAYLLRGVIIHKNETFENQTFKQLYEVFLCRHSKHAFKADLNYNPHGLKPWKEISKEMRDLLTHVFAELCEDYELKGEAPFYVSEVPKYKNYKFDFSKDTTRQ